MNQLKYSCQILNCNIEIEGRKRYCDDHREQVKKLRSSQTKVISIEKQKEEERRVKEKDEAKKEAAKDVRDKLQHLRVARPDIWMVTQLHRFDYFTQWRLLNLLEYGMVPEAIDLFKSEKGD